VGSKGKTKGYSIPKNIPNGRGAALKRSFQKDRKEEFTYRSSIGTFQIWGHAQNRLQKEMKKQKNPHNGPPP